MMYETKVKIGASDLTVGGVLRYSAIVDYMQDCSGFHLLSLPALQKYFKENGVGMYLVSRQIDIIRLPRYREECTVKTSIYEVKSLYGFRNTMIYGEDCELCVKSYAAGAFIDLTTTRPVKATAEVIGTVPLTEKADMEYLPRKIKLPAPAGRFSGEIKITKSYIDNYLHVNNAKYIDIAEEALPENFPVRRIRVDYRAPAKRGDMIKLYTYKEDDNFFVEMKDGYGIVFALIEFMA